METILEQVADWESGASRKHSILPAKSQKNYAIRQDRYIGIRNLTIMRAIKEASDALPLETLKNNREV